MKREQRTTNVFSGPLMKQTCRANVLLAAVILLVMCLMANVTNYAMSIMATDTGEGIDEATREDFYTYLFVLASYRQISGSELSYEDFAGGGDKSDYQKAFDLYNARKDEDDKELSVAGFEKIAAEVAAADTDPGIYVKQFEYVYALNGEKGCFSGEKLSPDEFMEVTLTSTGIAQEDLERMQDLDFTTFFTKIYFTVIGMLPTFVFVIIVANSLVAAQVDKGSMAYILSTPTKRCRCDDAGAVSDPCTAGAAGPGVCCKMRIDDDFIRRSQRFDDGDAVSGNVSCHGSGGRHLLSVQLYFQSERQIPGNWRRRYHVVFPGSAAGEVWQ